MKGSNGAVLAAENKLRADRHSAEVLASVQHMDWFIDDMWNFPTAMARTMNSAGVSTADGGRWHKTSVRRLRSRLEAVGLIPPSAHKRPERLPPDRYPEATRRRILNFVRARLMEGDPPSAPDVQAALGVPLRTTEHHLRELVSAGELRVKTVHVRG